MGPDKINVRGDPRIKFKSAVLNGRTYGYLLGQPQNKKLRATIFLVHGFPDLSMGWRYQIPFLIEEGFRVVALDTVGYGRTDAPDDYREYSLKRSADDIKELARQLEASKIIICGHDWGAFLTYRVALWHPDLVSHVITVCVPYFPPAKVDIPLEDLVRTALPNFGYQLQFKNERVEDKIVTKDQIRQFLICMYGGRTDDGELGFDVSRGIHLEKIGKLKLSRFLSEEEMDFYTEEFTRHGVHGPLKWYRTRKVNYEDELDILDRKITAPLLFIQAIKDIALPPEMGRSMSRDVPNLTVEQVNTTHWALWEDPVGVNNILSTWLAKHVPRAVDSIL